MATLQNKIDFALIFTVKNANPNGDPLGGNRPRTTSDGLGEVSDVCLKRKIRNRLQELGSDIFVQMDENNRDGKKSLSERFNDFLSTLSKDEQKVKDTVAAKACEKWMDVRSFGQVFAFKKGSTTAEVSMGIRGPVTIQSAFSKEPIVIESIQITKSVNGDPTSDGKKSSDTMGMKHRVSKAVYVTYGSISPQLAEKTGFSDGDADAIKNVLVSLFEGDESSARPSGSMQVLNVVWVAHNSKSGQYSSAKVHNSINVGEDGSVTIEELDGLSYEVLES
ncbi:type I-C CRISPR-associated protein Cas7/Csd2 [Aminipila luticellarii]|uniref:Type I-C CRISPR-associated protein Cas7/Csd2 n=1 Tax=Aminipila luticellarii TaxID=2507160 RepID=A0A410PWZ1_9FIRM|nr:type I-C CRISPR-associated protein Cas7/Csd2 [Aminipila luticellarii]QAT43424.1 type I-C CRISPR-associated protein Cas7/Csd2 [Aminipila luticellarii]